MREDELGRWKLALIGSDRPFRVVQIELRIDSDQIHIGFPIGVECSNVSPILNGFLIGVLKLEGVHPSLFDHLGDDIFSEIVCAALSCICDQVFAECLCAEEVDAH